MSEYREAAAASNEQWNRQGKCSLCRKKSYCKKRCRANKARRQALLAKAIGGCLWDALNTHPYQ